MTQVLQEQEAARRKLDEALRKLAEIAPDSLVRSEELGSALDFRKGVEVFRRSLGLFKSLQESNLDGFPTPILHQLTQVAQETLQAFQQIQQFNPTGQNTPASVRDNLINQVAIVYDRHFPQIAPVIAYSVRRGTDFERLEREARATLDAVTEIKTGLEKRTSEIVKQAQDALKQVQQAAAEVGVAQHAIHFRQEAAEHLRRSRQWLIATVLLGVLTLGFAVWVLYSYRTAPADLTTAQSLQLGIAKLFVFSVLSFAVVWSGRMYRAQWHNYVVNKHRQNALSTFETFVKAASDDQTKNAVLIQATQCIFSPQATGFVSHEPEAMPPAQILEIVRGTARDRPSGA